MKYNKIYIKYLNLIIHNTNNNFCKYLTLFMETGLVVIYTDSEYNIIKNYKNSYWFHSTSLI